MPKWAIFYVVANGQLLKPENCCSTWLFPSSNNAFFGGQSEHVDENLHTAPLLPVRKLRGITGTDLLIGYVTQRAVFAPFQSNMARIRKTAAP